jgi:DUF971 family protein
VAPGTRLAGQARNDKSAHYSFQEVITTMAGLQSGTPTPSALTVHSQSRVLEIAFSDGAEFKIPFELMRVYSPSAEVQGHGPGQEVLQTGKREVNVVELEPIGNYAVKPVFSDGHESGIFSWDYLYFLGSEQARLWADYLQRLEAAGVQRDAPMAAAGGHGCSSH